MKYFSGLLSILEEQTTCYEKVYHLKEEEQRLILSGKPEEIQRNTDEIESLTLMIRSMEKARQELIEALAQQYNLSTDTPTFDQVISVADEESADELQKIAERLVNVLQRTSQINEDNAYLIRRSLDFIDRSLEMLTGLSMQSDTYGGDGRRMQREAATMIVNRHL